MPGWTVAVVQPIGQWNSHKNLYQNLASDLVAHAVTSWIVGGLELEISQEKSSTCCRLLRWVGSFTIALPCYVKSYIFTIFMIHEAWAAWSDFNSIAPPG